MPIIKRVYRDNVFLIRENTVDQYILYESGCYEKLCHFEADDVWLDAGGHIGAFCIRYAPLVHWIYSFEPAPKNLQLLMLNVAENDVQNITIAPQAVIGGEDHIRDFYLNVKKNTASNSLHIYRGRSMMQVSCTNINTIIEELGITKMKIDIEGEEVAVLKAVTKENWKQIKEVIFEYHPQTLRDHDGSQYTELVEYMKKIFNHVMAPEKKKQRYLLVHCMKV